MAKAFNIGGHFVEVTRRNKRLLSLKVHEDGRITLSAPADASAREIQAFLDSRSAWLEKVLADQKCMKPKKKVLDLENRRLFYWGQEYGFELCKDAAKPGLYKRDEGFELCLPKSTHDPFDFLIACYAQEVLKQTPPLLEHWRVRMGLAPVHCTIRYMTSRWGSCTANTGRIRLNSLLASRLPECLEYVLVHELCHFFEHNHGSGFYKLLSDCLPDWKSREQNLKALE